MAEDEEDQSEERAAAVQRTPADGSESHPVVAIGASAGGVRALQEFFGNLPANTGAAFVVVVHLDPGGPSSLSEILAARTTMPMVEVKAREHMQPNHVYVIPPDRRLDIVTDHDITAAKFAEPRGKRSPIDLFFRSLAERLGDGFAVILTGAGSDGTIGARAVKEAGGIILVQDPVEAEYGSMPRNAIATGIADFVLPVRDLAVQLAELIRVKNAISIPDLKRVDEGLLQGILAHLRARTGHDFSKYKRSTLVRRIERRLQVTRTDELSAYYEHLRKDPEEVQALLSDFLISVTTFFRDAKTFEVLTSEVLPRLFGKEANEPIRIWVPGCATGEEVYSIAMVLLEEAARHDSRPAMQLFGSDLDARALTIAREGRYPVSIEADVSEERLRRYFLREPDGYRIRQEVRDIVLFASHNLLRDPPFSRVDLISCRNLLIYLNRELQEQVCGTFHYALNPGGFLLLGSSETADFPPGLFNCVSRTARIYQSTSEAGDRPHLLPQLLGATGRGESIGLAERPLTPSAALTEAAAHRRALEQIAPPSMLVDQTQRVVHLSENAGRYIQPSGGPLSGDVVDLVRPELRFELRTALHRAFEHQRASLSLPLAVRFNGQPHRVHLQVKPSAEPDDAPPRTAVVLFIEGEPVSGAAAPGEGGLATDDTVRHLTEQLEVAHERMRTMREESDAANEELRAANEELQSINEEYRSTSEELETSKEELQSINEELQTVNSELKMKLEMVSRANSDLQNLMAAADFGTLFLDTGLRIKRFTDRTADLFSITPADVGRPITDFAHRLDYDDLVRDAQAVLADLVPVSREVRGRNNGWYGVRVRPYRTVDDKIDGVVITFVDLTERRRMEEELRTRQQELQQQKQLVDLSHEPIFVWDFDSGIIHWNRGCEELFGYARQETVGQHAHALLATKPANGSFDDVQRSLEREGRWSGELKQRARDGRELTMETRMVLESFDGRRLVLESSRDITDRKAWERRQEMLLSELAHRVKNTLAVVQAIAHQTQRTSSSSEDFIERFDGRLSALAAAHRLLVQSDWNGAELAALAREQLEAHVAENPDRVRLSGEPVVLPPDLATPFGLVLHELSTNAAKYGSLSRPDGTVTVSWTVGKRNNERLLTIVWEEAGGPPAQAPKQIGFGSRLIDNSIPKTRVKREFRPDGLVCTIEVALPGLTDGTIVET
ncbi:MAG: chemotaxis protein CheB [Xanthobacteraceae bacterium]